MLELTGGRPQLTWGTMLYDDASRGPQHANGGFLHGVRDKQLRQGEATTATATYFRAMADGSGTIECDNSVVFPYFYDMRAEDGGVFVLPGSHKSEVVRPGKLFGALGQDSHTVVKASGEPGHIQSADAWQEGVIVPEGASSQRLPRAIL